MNPANMTEQCTSCQSDLEVGQIGKCGDCFDADPPVSKEFARFERYIRGGLNSAKSRIEKFQKELASSPYHALSWADPVFRAAAIINLLGYYDGADPEMNLNELRANLTERLIRVAKNVPASTSDLTNKLANEERVVLAELVEEMNRILG